MDFGDKSSVKHHYLPQFYLKGFTDESGKFAIYDYSTNRIKANLQTPSSHFFSLERNTIQFNNQKSDMIEQLYSIIDSKHAKVINLIQETNSAISLKIEDASLLQEFISYLFWRLPVNDALYEEELKNNPIYKKTFKIIHKETGEEASDEKRAEIMESEAMVKAVRAFVSSVSQSASIEHINKGNWVMAHAHYGFRLCSDNPIIFKKTGVKNVFEDDFIFPISKHHILIRTLGDLNIEQAPPSFNYILDMMVYKQGTIYCCCSKREYLERIIKDAKEFQMEDIRKMLFQCLAN